MAVHVRDESVGDANGAVRLLIVFENGEIRAAYGESGAVEGMQVLGLLGAGGAVADVGASRLKVKEVGTGADLAVESLAGQLDLKIISFG